MLCRVLEVSVSGFYAFCSRKPSRHKQRDLLLGDRIESIYRRSRSTYGQPRIHAELKEDGIAISGRRIARLMRERHCHGASRRRGIVTTLRDRDARPAPDLVDRNFTATAPNQLWVADITYVPTRSGFLFLAVVLDVFSRRVVGCSMASHMRKELVVNALDMAIYRRKPTAVVHHLIRVPNTLRSRSECVAARPASNRRWVPSATATITQCVKASTRRWNASCSPGIDSKRRGKLHSPCSTSSKASTIRIGATLHSATYHRTTTSGA